MTISAMAFELRRNRRIREPFLMNPEEKKEMAHWGREPVHDNRLAEASEAADKERARNTKIFGLRSESPAGEHAPMAVSGQATITH
jgi:hypothetical protein